MTNVLIVDDDENIRTVIRTYCLNEKYNIFEADDGYRALDIVKEKKVDIIILDIMMPKLDGYSVLKIVKSEYKIPVIMLTAKGMENDILGGFEIGCDDYVLKPFSPRELMARIKAVIQRYKNEDNIYIDAGIEINYGARSLCIDGKEVSLTPKEFDLLSYLSVNKGNALKREDILSSVWGYDFFGDDRTVDTHIKMLRNSLGKYRNTIETVRSYGYKFVDYKNE